MCLGLSFNHWKNFWKPQKLLTHFILNLFLKNSVVIYFFMSFRLNFYVFCSAPFFYYLPYGHSAIYMRGQKMKALILLVFQNLETLLLFYSLAVWTSVFCHLYMSGNWARLWCRLFGCCWIVWVFLTCFAWFLIRKWKAVSGANRAPIRYLFQNMRFRRLAKRHRKL